MTTLIETQAIVVITPHPVQTTFIAPFSDNELLALVTVHHVRDETQRSMMLHYASAEYVGHPNDSHELHEAFYLVNHGILYEVSSGWYAFTESGSARAHATPHADPSQFLID